MLTAVAGVALWCAGPAGAQRPGGPGPAAGPRAAVGPGAPGRGAADHAAAVVPATVAPLARAQAPAHDILDDISHEVDVSTPAAKVTRTGPGYWLVGGDGGVFPFGRGAYEGGMAERSTNAPIVAGAVTRSGIGYWLVASDGGVFAFGDAGWAGALPGHAPHARIVGIAAPDRAGYWLAGADGAVYAFGDAPYLGGMGGRGVPTTIVGIARTPSGRGYWLAGADGSVYAFGDARYLGGAGSVDLQASIVGIAPSPTGAGYWLAGRDGGVYAFGDAAYRGSLSGQPHADVIGIAATPEGGGYWLAGADGGVFAFGTAGYFGSIGSSRLNRRLVGIVSGVGVAIPKAPPAPDRITGFDISWPQCGSFHPAPPYGFGVVGVTDGHLFSVNPCLHQQWGWAVAYGSFAATYINTNAPDAGEFAAFASGPAASCGPNTGCVLDRWGRAGVRAALQAAGDLPAPMVWLDVETGNQWLPDTAANAVVLRAMIDELQKAGKRVGVYSTSLQWGDIAGDYAPGLPLWIPGAPPENPAAYCSGHEFAGGVTWMAQSGDANFDTDVLCGAGLASYRTAFAYPAPLAVPQYVPPTIAPAARAGRPADLGAHLRGIAEAAASGAAIADLAVAPRHRRGLAWLGILAAVAALAGLGVVGQRRLAGAAVEDR